MNVAQMFRTVSEGRVVTRSGYAWSCPQCGALLGESRSPDSRDRWALAHCLLHTLSTGEAGGAPPVSWRFPESWRGGSALAT